MTPWQIPTLLQCLDRLHEVQGQLQVFQTRGVVWLVITVSLAFWIGYAFGRARDARG